MVVAVADALRLGEDGLRAGAGEWGGAVGAGRDAGAQVAAEQRGRESRFEPVADRWGCAGCYRFLRGSGGAVVGPGVVPGPPGWPYGVRRAGAGREGELAGAGCCAAGRAPRVRMSCTACR
ncbi:hypothetical protein GCM10018777_12410 [Streptomyces albogriseolus]|nr:hypothetical protein GCM10018777_12410 [Streptomyces viridodiastaticus]